MNNPHKCQ
jgi:hypothetical protein